VPGHHPLVPAFDGAAVPLGEVLDRQVELLREAHHAGQPVAAGLLRGTGTILQEPALLVLGHRIGPTGEVVVDLADADHRPGPQIPRLWRLPG
jgi:hypothetical protein